MLYKRLLVILPPANTHPPCGRSAGMKLCPAEQVLIDFCLNDVLWAWHSCWHLLTTQDACILLQQLCFSLWICSNRKALGGRVSFSSYCFSRRCLAEINSKNCGSQTKKLYRLISSMNITALATSHAVARICTNQNETTRNRRAEQRMQGTASACTFSTSAAAGGGGQPPALCRYTSPEYVLQ